jgi:hypothetical protein
MHGLVLVCEILTRKTRKKMGEKIPSLLTKVGGIITTFSFLSLTLILFRANDLSKGLRMIHDLFFNISRYYEGIAVFREILFFIWPLILVQLLQYKKNDLLAVLKLPVWTKGVIYFTMYYLLVTYGVEGGKEFIYFQF